MAEVVMPAGTPTFSYDHDFSSTSSPSSSQEDLRVHDDTSTTSTPSAPTFVFPMRPEPRPTPSQPHRRSLTAASLLEGSASRGGNAASARGRAPLPSFSFNPSASDEKTDLHQRLTPPPSPNFEIPTTPTQGGRHRRARSEWIGSNGSSTFPKAAPSDPLPSLPQATPATSKEPALAPSAAIKGHRHRRSGAISASDLPVLSPPSPSQPSISSPPRPSRRGHRRTPSTLSGDSFSTEAVDVATVNDSSARTSVDSTTNPTFTPRSKSRVTFSDIPDFVPRPLSTISSATETSTSTFRGHSLAGSISSQMPSLSEASPTSRSRACSASSSQDRSSPLRRPRSAGLVTECNKNPAWSDPPSPTRELRRPISASAIVSFPQRSSDESLAILTLDNSKVQKLGNWAASLIGRTAKPQQLRRSPRNLDVGDVKLEDSEPAAESLEDIEPAAVDDIFDETGLADENFLNVNFDEDPTSAIESDDPHYAPQFSPLFLTATTNHGDTVDSMIDINEAMRVSANIELNPKSFAIARRNMHSGGRESHRRAGSAPLLPSPEFSMPSPRRFQIGAAETPALDDVFEEEAEEEPQKPLTAPGAFDSSDGSASTRAPTSGAGRLDGLGIGVNIVEYEGRGGQSQFGHAIPQTAGLAVPQPSFGGHGRRSSWAGPQALSLGAERNQVFDAPSTPRRTPPPPSTAGTSHSVAISDTDDEPFDSGMQLRPETPSLAATNSPHTPVSLTHIVHWDSPRAAGFGESADSSQVDTRARLPQFIFGEPGMDRRISSDEVPSLISSRSTMTSAIHAPLPDSISHSRTELTSSSASTSSINHRKRSSIASLGRLMSGPFSARKSNLSMEQTLRCQTSDGLGGNQAVRDKTDKKTKRLSKLIKFWNPKKSLSQLTNPRRASASTLRTEVTPDH